MKTAINLLPHTLRQRQIARRRIVQWGAITGSVLLLVWFAGWAKLREYDSLSQKLDILTREHRPSDAMLQELIAMRNVLQDLGQEEQVAQELERQRPILSLLGAVSKAAHDSDGKVQLTKLALVDLQGTRQVGRGGLSGASSGSLMLSGLSLNNPAVAELIDGLQESGLFAEVKLVSLTERQYNGVALQEYEVRCEL